MEAKGTGWSPHKAYSTWESNFLFYFWFTCLLYFPLFISTHFWLLIINPSPLPPRESSAGQRSQRTGITCLELPPPVLLGGTLETRTPGPQQSGSEGGESRVFLIWRVKSPSSPFPWAECPEVSEACSASCLAQRATQSPRHVLACCSPPPTRSVIGCNGSSRVTPPHHPRTSRPVGRRGCRAHRGAEPAWTGAQRE